MRYLALLCCVVALCMGQNCAWRSALEDAAAGGNNGGGAAEAAGDGVAGGDGSSGSGETPQGSADDVDDSPGVVAEGAIVADHLACAAFDSIPAGAIETVRSGYRIWYGHTSHGSQILTGMQMIYSADGRFAFNAGPGSLSIEEDGGVDLGHEGDTGWVDLTRGILNLAGNDRNIVLWSWCGGVSDNTEAGIAAYLAALNQLEADYPGVTFIYMTGHLDGTGPAGNLYARNNQIRDYCRAHGKVLFDFADIESYDPAGNYYPMGTDWCEWCETWAGTHGVLACDECAHSQCFNCYQKGRAFWWMMARLSGWAGT